MAIYFTIYTFSDLIFNPRKFFSTRAIMTTSTKGPISLMRIEIRVELAYLEHHIQHFRSKVYYKVSKDQRSVNNHQETFDILEEMIEENVRTGGRRCMHCLEE